MNEAKILVIGSINMDLVVQAGRMPGPGETVMGHTFVTVPGGKGSNQAVAAARLGAQVHMVGAIGADDFGNELRDGLEDEGIDTTHVGRVDIASGVALIQVDALGENAITVVPGANGAVRLPPPLAFDTLLASAGVALMQLEIPLETVVAAIHACKAAGVPIILDPAPVPDAGLPELLYHVDVFTPNQHEATVLSGIQIKDRSTAEQAARYLKNQGAQRVVLKMGSEGAYVLDTDNVFDHVAATKAPVVDTTAAGDAFTAALGVGLARGWSLVEATRLGCAAGSLAVRSRGAQDAMPVWDDVADLL
ncbi:MAG: ribokinase [Bacteroidota bacterium]